MRLLFDTHVLLWAASTPEKLPAKIRSAINDPANGLFYSSVNILEVAIKNSMPHRFVTSVPDLLAGLSAAGYRELPVTSRHAMLVEHLPLIHKDPFDRLLIAQAQVEGMLLVTVDRQIKRYLIQ